MAQEKYLRLSHFKPDGHPEVYPGMSDEVREMMPYLVGNVSKGWTKILNHNLEAFATRKMNVPSLGFRKGRKEVYVHIFCNEFMNPFYACLTVTSLYTKFNLGKPTFAPEEPNWIHTIPLPNADLTQEETLLIHQIAHSLLWTIFMDYSEPTGLRLPANSLNSHPPQYKPS
jgi:hypothetical protein